jgi:type IV secretory pathway VirB2 component (pilin)
MWHLRIVERAGDALAANLYGATRAAGVELCAAALAAPHEALALKYGCARTLLELDPEQFAISAGEALAAVKQAQPRDAADRLVQAAAERLLAKVEGNRARCAAVLDVADCAQTAGGRQTSSG